MGAAKTCGGWRSFRALRVSAASVQGRHIGGAAPSPAPTEAAAARAGIDMSATALELDIWAPTVRWVRKVGLKAVGRED